MVKVTIGLEKEGFESQEFEEDVTTSTTKVVKLKPIAIEKVLTPEQMQMPPDWPPHLQKQWEELMTALKKKNPDKVLQVLRSINDPKDPPGVPIAAVLGILPIVELILGLIGSYPFARFLNEETLQTIDMAIYTALSNRQYDLARLAMQKKQLILEKIRHPGFLGLIPIANVIEACKLFFDASAAKLKIDQAYLDRKIAPYMPPQPGDIEGAARAIEYGQDPSQYLPPVPLDPEIAELLRGYEKDVEEYYWKVNNAISLQDFERASKYLEEYEKRIDAFDKFIDQYAAALKAAWLYDEKKEFVARHKENIIDLQSKITKTMDKVVNVGTLRIDCNVPAADVYIAGKRVGVTPFEEEMAVGTYNITVKKYGYTEDSTTLEVKKGETTSWTAHLTEEAPPSWKPPEEPTYAVKIKTIPVDGAKIYVDGVNTWFTTPATIFVTKKEHLLRLEKKDYMPIEVSLTISDIEAGEKIVELMPLEMPAQKPNCWAYTINSIPSGALIYVDDVSTGKYTNTTIYLAPNSTFRLKLEKSYYKPWETTINVPPLPES
jgi:hypothetical protein